MAFKKPVIALAHTPTNEIINHRETGIIVDKNDPQLIAQAIEELLLTKKLSQKIANQARTVAQERFNIVNSAQIIIREINNCL